MKFLSIYRFTIFYIFLIGAFFLASCTDDGEEDVSFVDPPTQNLELVAQEQGSLNIFIQAVNAAGLGSALTGSDALTIFAPSNGAFQSFLNSAGFDSVDEVPANLLATVLSYHIVNGSVLSSDLTTGQVETLISGSSIGVVVGESITLNGEATVIDADNNATNGVIHVIDLVLGQIPIDPIATLVDSLASASTPEFTILNAAIQKAGLTNTLNTTEGLTVLAPTDAAFEAAGLDMAAIDALTAEEVAEVLVFHVLSGYSYSVQFVSGSRVFTLLGAEGEAKGLDVSEANAPIILNTSAADPLGAAVIGPNVLANNGVIHVLDAVLFPKDYTWERLFASDFRYAEFRDALLNGNNDDLVEILSTEENFTILAPSPAGLVPLESSGLSEPEKREILERHIFDPAENGDFTTLGSIPSGSKITSIGGNEYFVTQNADGTYFNGTLTVQEFNGSDDSGHEDIDVYNGFVTALGPNLANDGSYISGNFGFLEPLPASAILDSLSAKANVAIFTAVLEKLEILDGLEGVTVFAIDDAAFSNVIASVTDVEALDPDNEEDAATLADLEEIISDYIISDLEFAVDIDQDLPTVTALSGRSLSFVFNFDNLMLEILNVDEDDELQDNLALVEVDILTGQGVAHIIDGLLFED